MTLGRVWGTLAIDRFGRVRVLRVTAGLVVLGVLLVVFGAATVSALVASATRRPADPGSRTRAGRETLPK